MKKPTITLENVNVCLDIPEMQKIIHVSLDANPKNNGMEINVCALQEMYSSREYVSPALQIQMQILPEIDAYVRFLIRFST